VAEDTKAFDIREARKLWAAKSGPSDKKARQKKRSKIAATIDKRSLRATGRTEQFNFRASPEMIASVRDAASAAGIPIAEWMEDAVAAYLAKARGDGNA
jgi:predicted HicB family RNase H-like nuclease